MTDYFVRRTRLYDDDGRTIETMTRIGGEAIKVRGLPSAYASLGLVEAHAPTLLFTPDDQLTDDEFVRPGDEIQWSGATFVVRDVNTVNPDGEGVVVARIIVVRGPR